MKREGKQNTKGMFESHQIIEIGIITKVVITSLVSTQSTNSIDLFFCHKCNHKVILNLKKRN